MGLCSWNIGIMEYGELWKNCRKLFHEFLNARAATKFNDYQRKHAYRLLLHLVETPEELFGHIEL